MSETKRRRWLTKSGVAVLEHSRMKMPDRRGRPAVKIEAHRVNGGFHGWLWLRELRSLKGEPPPTVKRRLDDALAMEAARQIARHRIQVAAEKAPIPMRLTCPECGVLHVDRGLFATKPHHTHACQRCGMVWRPAIVATVGVQFLPGFKDAP